MGFTTSCFIRKNTPELRNRLKKLGIRPFLCDEELNAIGANIKVHNGMVAAFTCSDSLNNCDDLIDCGTNEDLFLALAALRDDTDKEQFFVTEVRLGSINYPDTIIEKGALLKCCMDKWKIPKNKFDSMGIPSHKATVEELIEHFKGKEELCQDL